MNDGLDTALVLPDVGEKPSKPYRSSPYTVRQYAALPFAQRLAVDAACDEAAGLVRTTYADDTSPQPFTVGRATTARLSPTAPMITAYVHPAPSPALHLLNTPEVIHHDAAHPDSLATHATELVGPACAYPGHGALPPLAALTDAVAQAAEPTAPAAPIAHAGTVYETTDYDLFHLLPENRVIDPGHVRKLVGQIKANNLLHLKPLDVTPELGIIDGQHRWAAARELGLPIFYKVGQQFTESAITALNVGQKNWAATDYLHYWTVKRKPAYVAFTDFRQRHPRISFSNAKIMLTGKPGGLGADIFRLGQWDGADDADVALAEQVAELVERIATETPFKQPTHTGFVGALYHCVVNVKGFEAAELMRTILNQPLSLLPCASHKQWLEMLEKIYNYRKNEDNRIRFV